MTSINIVALQKRFALSGGFLGSLLSQIYTKTYFKSILTIQGVIRNGKCNEMGLDLRYMTLSNIVTLQKKVFFYEADLFGSFFVPNF